MSIMRTNRFSATCLASALAGVFLLFLSLAVGAGIDDQLAAVERALKTGDLARAVELASASAALSPLDAEAQALYGLALLRWGEFGSAEESLRLALSLDPACSDSHFAMAELAWGRRKLKSAAEHIQAASGTRRFRGEALLLLALLHAEAGNHAAAIAASGEGIKLADYLPEEKQVNVQGSIEFLRSLGDKKLYLLPQPFQKTVLDLERRGSHLFLRARANGQEAGLFYLDTANTGNLIISGALAGRLGLQTVGRFKHKGVGDRQVVGSASILDQFELGRLTVSNVPVRIVNSDLLKGDVAGIIGRSLLLRFNFSIDYPGLRLLLFHSDRPDLQERDMDEARIAARIPLFYSDLPLVPVKIEEGQPAPFAIDTGSANTLIEAGYYENYLKDTINSRAAESVEIYGVGGKVKARRLNVGSLSLGRIDARDVKAVVADVEGFKILRRRICGVIGDDLLSAYILHFNQSKSEIVFEEAR